MSNIASPPDSRQYEPSFGAQKLTLEERRWLELNDMPASLRDEILFGCQADSVLYSLNNVTADAGPNEGRGNTGFNGFGVENLGLAGVALGQVDGPCSLLTRFPSDLQAYQKRDAMMAVLRECLPGVEWSGSFWAFYESYKGAALGVFGIEDNSFDPYRVFTFKRCYASMTRGATYTNKVDPNDVYHHRLHCCEPGCLDCRDRERQRLAGEKLDSLKQIIAVNPGCPGVLELTWTLPEAVEHLGNDPKVVTALMAGQQDIVRKLFGVGSRSNVGMIAVNHPIGDRDLFRDRAHQHVLVVPGQVVKGSKAGVSRFEWLEPTKVVAGHTNVDWKLDFVWLRAEWWALLKGVFGADCPEPANPEVRFVPYNSGSRLYRGREDRAEEIFFKILGHKLKYSMRGWGKDIERAVLRTSPEAALVVLKAQRGGDEIHWELSPVGAIAERFKWIRQYNKVSCRGFLQCLEKYRDVLGLCEEVLDVMPECLPAEAKVEIIRGKRWDSKAERVKWVRDEIYYWTCPVSGLPKVRSKKELKPWVSS